MNSYISLKDAEYREGYVANYARFVLKCVVAPVAMVKWVKEWINERRQQTLPA